jgi:anhydro-N-acetylmuramic acid kinase
LRWLVCGGGRRNPVLMAALASALGAPVDPVEALGWRGDALEAEAFAFLAARSLRGLPLSLPSTTGVPSPLTGGTLHRN